MFFWGEGILFYYTEMHKIELLQLFTKAKRFYWHWHLKCYEITKMKMSFKTTWRPKPDNRIIMQRLFWQDILLHMTLTLHEQHNLPIAHCTGLKMQSQMPKSALPEVSLLYVYKSQNLTAHLDSSHQKISTLCFPASLRKICLLTACCLKQPKIGQLIGMT